MKRLLTLLPLFLMITGCNQSPPPADSSVITSRSEAWEMAFNAKDIDALVDLYESDARLLPPNAEMNSGSDAFTPTVHERSPPGCAVIDEKNSPPISILNMPACARSIW